MWGTKKRVSLIIIAFLFLLTISLIYNTSLLLPEFSSGNGIREGELVVVRSAEQDEPLLKVVHLDLKGAPPKLSYLRQLLPVLAKAGCNALLVEYEDMFPYHGMLANISARNSYTQHQILDFLSWCHDLNIEVIPLVQTFGHLEYVLKLEEFRHLRELDSFPQELCPSKPDSLSLVYEIVRQVLSLHRTAKYIHIGCDEVYHLVACSKCTQRNMNAREIFAEHVTIIAQHIRKSYSGITPLIWDDMMRQWNPQFLSSTSLGELVEPVIWVYTDKIHNLVPHYLWHSYSKTFQYVWIAGAFKGATLSTSVLPDIRNHYDNQKAWLAYTLKTSNRIRGHVLTGWSRYDHFAVLCELLPSSVPSLLLNLLLISSKNPEEQEKILRDWRNTMKCSPSSEINIDSMSSDPRSVSSCSFEGANAYVLMSNYLTLKNRVDWLYTYLTERNAWLTPYNIKHNFTSPFRIIDDFNKTNFFRLLNEIKLFRNETTLVLANYFDFYTVNEWIEQRIEPLETKLTLLEKQVINLIQREIWPRRPLASR